jgi:hypothetical protein
MAVATQSSIPSVIIAGDTVIFTVGSNALYPNTGWTLKFALNRDGKTLKSWAAASATDGTLGFVVTLPATDTAKLPPGRANAALIYVETGSGQRQTDNCGPNVITITPDPTQSLSDSDAAKALQAANAAITQLAGDPYQSVNFNGQSYNGKNLKELMDARDRISITVAAELAEIGIGTRRGGYRIVQTRFR